MDVEFQEMLEGIGVPAALLDDIAQLDEAGEDDPTFELVCFRFKEENITVAEGLSRDAVVEFCSRDDTDDGDRPAAWFFGWRAE